MTPPHPLAVPVAPAAAAVTVRVAPSLACRAAAVAASINA